VQFIRIVILCVLAAVAYGVIHDQITARICIEYFTIGHRRIITSTSPTMLALAWGVVATWWMGVLLGVPLAICARAGRWPRLTAEDLHRRIVIVLLVMLVLASVSAMTGRILAVNHRVWLVGRIARELPPERHVDYLTVMWSHLASYAAGSLGGVYLCIAALRMRKVASKKDAQSAASTAESA
jgi:hypothetical protein